MSCVYLIAADKPLPLCDRQAERTSTVMVEGKPFTIGFVRGFRVAEHSYYRGAVNALNLSMKPYQYELEAEVHEEDLANLKTYLRENFAAGETVELWNLWVGIDRSDRIPHFQGHLSDFDMDTLEQFRRPPAEPGTVGQCRMTIII